MPRSPWRVTIRTGPRVERSSHGSLAEALDALDEAASALERSGPRRRTVSMRVREFTPVQQVAARVEVTGPGRLAPAVKAGIDIRGDGSAEAFVGRPTRRLVEQRPGESAAAALRRELTDTGASDSVS